MDALALCTLSLVAPLQTGRGLAVAAVTALAGCLVVASSFVRTMVPLRTLAVLSNLAFLAAALLAPDLLSALLYGVLIPINTYRMAEIIRLTNRVNAVSRDSDLTGVWLKPYMRAKRLRAGTTLFRQGDKADSLYLLVEGKIELVEIGGVLPVGQLFGEISFFSPSRVRTLSARCETDCLVLSMHGATLKQLYFQDPKFAFTISHLITQRLTADITRLQKRIAALESEHELMEDTTPGVVIT
jgi:CRP/FNR family transcriptional regulator, cyclic AMP receptor protein